MLTSFPSTHTPSEKIRDERRLLTVEESPLPVSSVAPSAQVGGWVES